MSGVRFTGAVLAGGASRRMGRDKALLLVAGEPAWARQVRVLREAGAEPIGVVRRREQPPLAPELRVWTDPVPQAGPLAGLVAALTACDTPLLAVLATDMPSIDSGWFKRLLSSSTTECGAVGRFGSGRYEPLAALYPRVALAEATHWLTSPARSVQALVASLEEQGRVRAVPLASSEVGRFKSWNEPGDVEGQG